MKKKRLDRDLKWGFQHFPYYQMRVDIESFHGLACLIELTDGKTLYWNLPKAGQAAVAGKGMIWLQLVPDGQQRLITAKYLPDNTVSVWYVDVIDGVEYAADGVAVYVDKYLDVYFTPQGDVVVDDRDELDTAYQSGELSRTQYEGALLEGERIVAELCSDVQATEAYCNKVLVYVKQRIAEGEPLFKCQADTAIELTYKKATLNDLDLLAETRIAVLLAANQLSEDTDMSEVRNQSLQYYREALQNDTHVAYFVMDGENVVGTGGVSFFRVMPTYHNPTGWKAYIMNMYTNPEYRRRGIASHTLDLLVEEAKKRRITSISLEATEMGRPLYERYGFVKMKDEMELPIQQEHGKNEIC